MRQLLTIFCLLMSLVSQAQFMTNDRTTLPPVGRPRPSFDPATKVPYVVNNASGAVEIIPIITSVNGVSATTATSGITIPTGVTNTAGLTNDAGFVTASTVPVPSVAGRIGAITLTKSDVNLANVDNTSDANKPVSNATNAALAGKEPTITAGSAGQVILGNKTLGTLNPALVNLGNVPNTDATQRSNHTGTQPVATIVGAVSLVQGITPTNGAITIPQATTANDGIITAAQVLRLGKSAQSATFTLSSAPHGQTLTHNLGTTNISFSFRPPLPATTDDTSIGYVVVDANSVTLTTPYNGTSRETATGTAKIIALY